jgi:hypothetical protein
VKITELTPIPQNSNPYHYDALNVGASLDDVLMADSLKGVYIMSNYRFGDKLSRSFRIVDTITGARYVIELPPLTEV